MSHLRRVNIETGSDGNPTGDAFGRVRISAPVTVFDSRFQYNILPLIFQTVTANNGTVTHSAPNAAAVLALDGTSGGSALIQSRQYVTYMPGKSLLVLMTVVVGSAVAGVTKRVGFFDDNNGIFFEQNGTTDIAFVQRTNTSGSPSDAARVAQANWNLDKLDGTGESGFTLDVTKGQIMVIDLQWLGMGRVRVGFDIGGRIVYVHEFLNANTMTTVYMRQATLPVRWSISGNSAASMNAVCSSVQSEGGVVDPFSYQFAYDRATVTAASGSQTYAFSIRPKATFNSLTNRIKINIIDWSCFNLGSNPVLVEIYYGTTVGGAPSWADMNATYSALQVDTAGTPSGGIKIASFWSGPNSIGAGGRARDAVQLATNSYPLALDVAGTGYTHLTVYVTGVGGTSDCRPAVTWSEDR